MSAIIDAGSSINLYMFHGGTNFGFINGAMHFHDYKSDVTSYGKCPPGLTLIGVPGFLPRVLQGQPWHLECIWLECPGRGEGGLAWTVTFQSADQWEAGAHWQATSIGESAGGSERGPPFPRRGGPAQALEVL